MTTQGNLASCSYSISGAASGIGKAVVNLLLKRSDAHIFAFDSNGQSLQENFGSEERVTRVEIDVRDKKKLQEVVRFLPVRSPLKGIIACAGVLRPNSYSDPIDQWDEVLDINLTGTYLFVQELVPRLQSDLNSPGHIIALSSVLARQGVPGFTGYSVSKAGVEALIRCWAQEYANRGVLVNAITPGWVDTPMAKDAFKALSERSGADIDTVIRNSLRKGLLPKMTDPSEIAELVGFLLSPQQKSITGQCLSINNGVHFS